MPVAQKKGFSHESGVLRRHCWERMGQPVSLIFNQLNKELYQKFFLTTEELQACRDGYIYIHDMSARRDTMNCCLFDVSCPGVGWSGLGGAASGTFRGCGSLTY